MELIKWVLSASVGLFVTLAGVSLAVVAIVFSTAIKIIGLFTLIAAGLALIVKEAIDSKSNK